MKIIKGAENGSIGLKSAFLSMCPFFEQKVRIFGREGAGLGGVPGAVGWETWLSGLTARKAKAFLKMNGRLRKDEAPMLGLFSLCC